MHRASVVAFTLLFSLTIGALPVWGAPPSARKDTSSHTREGAQRSDRRAKLLADADDIATTLRNSPRRSDAAELRLRETRLRVVAALLDSPESRAPDHVLALAEAAQNDRRQPTAARFEAARLLAMAERKGARFTDRDAWLEARERGARQLISDFPAYSQAFDELLAVADVSDAPRAVRLARELSESAASDSIKARAQEIAWRHTAIDQPITEVLTDVPGAGPLLAQVRGKVAVIYTWSPDDERSVELARALTKILPAEAVCLAINTSPRVAEALARVTQDQLPGAQLYGARGFDSPVVRRLGLTRASLLYVIGSDGVIHDFTAAADRASALTQLK